jgi:anti-anti-sigma factor
VSEDQPPSTRVAHHDAVTCVAVDGEIDIVKAHDLREQLTGAVRNEDLGLVIDLSETSYIDSVGVSLLFELAERLAERQLRMAVVLPEAGLVTRVLTIVNLSSVAEIHATADEAVGSISRN